MLISRHIREETNKEDQVCYWWWCPGCADERRGPNGEEGSGLHIFDERWTFNGNFEAPSFQASYLSRTRWGDNQLELLCHSFVTDGMIQYLSDSTHKFAGQTIPMVDLPKDWT